MTMPDDFEAAWAAYPRRTGSKYKAFLAYMRARKDGDTHPDILAGIERYKAFVASERARGFDLHYQYATTFFNQRGWQSEWQDSEPPGIELPW